MRCFIWLLDQTFIIILIKMEVLNTFEIFRTDVHDDLKLLIKSFYVFKTKNCNENSKNYCNNALFVTIDDKVFGFGQNDNGVCGQGCNDKIKNPLIITELCDKNVIDFFNGETFAMALTSDNSLFVWGVISDEDNSFSVPIMFSLDYEI